MKTLIELVFILGFLQFVHTQTSCVTPNGEQAQCISIFKCSVFLNALKLRSPRIVRFMRQSHCGYNTNNDPLVCCGSVVKHILPTKPIITKPSPVSIEKAKILAPRKTCGIAGVVDKIFTGNEVGLDEYPWLVLLEYKKNGQSVGHNCTGVIINERYVLTAAHCLVGRIEHEVGQVFRVRLGEHNLLSAIDCTYYLEANYKEEVCADPPVNINIEEIIPHSQYNDKSINKYHDIGLIRLSKTIQYTDFIKPICLPLNLEETKIGKNVIAAEWDVLTTIPLKDFIPVMSPTQCNSVFNPKNITITRTQICAGGRKDVEFCVKERGGPLMAYFPDTSDFYLEGISSFGAAICEYEGIPKVYTRVTEYLVWITDNMKQ